MDGAAESLKSSAASVVMPRKRLLNGRLPELILER